MAKIALFEVNEKDKAYVKAKLKPHRLIFFEKPINNKDLKKIKDVEALVVFTFSQVNKYVLNALPVLKFIATMSTGFDHIDLEECKKRNIIVSNVPSYGERTVAEHAFALILTITKNILQAATRTKSGDFRLDGLLGADLNGKTIGLVGCGNIGKNVAKIARGFDMNVLVYDVIHDDSLANSVGFKYASMEDVLKNSDFISLHVPYNKHTHHLINKKNIRLIKKRAVLINTSRGGVIDTEALICALDKKILYAVGLDVLENECFILKDRDMLSKEFKKSRGLKKLTANAKLIKRENVLITPHSAFYTKEALDRILNTTLENVLSFINGKIVNEVKL